jgi:hypothetical protein
MKTTLLPPGFTKSHVFRLATVVFLAKVIYSFTLENGILLGADGENYLSQVESLEKDGVFSKDLLYWPAGYAVSIWVFKLLTFGSTLVGLSILQSFIWSLSVYALTNSLKSTNFKKYTTFLAYLLLLNPTLSLSSIAVGYESVAASISILSLSLCIYAYQSESRRKKFQLFASAALLMGYASVLQPRLIPGYLLCLAAFTWQKKLLTKEAGSLVLVVLMCFAVFPTTLIAKNLVSNNQPVMSTNLGINMLMGAGDNSTGAYNTKPTGITCSAVGGNESATDREKVKCALGWHLDNPIQSINLAFKKSTHFWSTWWGPVSTGTSGRNPYLDFHPIKSLIQTREDLVLVAGPVGVAFSWIIILLGWLLLVLGTGKFLHGKPIEQRIGFGSIAIVLGSWVASVAVFGDNRFRIPIMGLSILIQLNGLSVLGKMLQNSFGKKKRRTNIWS